MDVVAALVVIVALAVVVIVVGQPLRGGGARAETDAEFRVAELEARRDAKYREIRDCDLDFRTGKMSEEDHRAMDRELRAEAMEILRELDEAEALVSRQDS